MRVSKKQLKRIIREERTRLKEVVYSGSELDMAKDELLGILQAMDPDEGRAEIYALIDELETLAETGR